MRTVYTVTSHREIEGVTTSYLHGVFSSLAGASLYVEYRRDDHAGYSIDEHVVDEPAFGMRTEGQ